jgi:hypothetical protein
MLIAADAALNSKYAELSGGRRDLVGGIMLAVVEESSAVDGELSTVGSGHCLLLVTLVGCCGR